MRNTLKHLTLLTRMKDDGLLPALTGSFSEDAIAQACGQVETLQLQERLHIRKTKRIQEELIRVPNFAALYGVLCRQEIGDEEIASVLESADGYFLHHIPDFLLMQAKLRYRYLLIEQFQR